MLHCFGHQLRDVWWYADLWSSCFSNFVTDSLEKGTEVIMTGVWNGLVALERACPSKKQWAYQNVDHPFSHGGGVVVYSWNFNWFDKITLDKYRRRPWAGFMDDYIKEGKVLNIYWSWCIRLCVRCFSLVILFDGLPWWLRWWGILLQCRSPGFSLQVRKIPCRREWLLTPVFLPEEFHGQGNLAGYSPWSCREFNTL